MSGYIHLEFACQSLRILFLVCLYSLGFVCFLFFIFNWGLIVPDDVETTADTALLYARSVNKTAVIDLDTMLPKFGDTDTQRKKCRQRNGWKTAIESSKKKKKKKKKKKE